MSNENLFVELDQRQIEEISGGIVLIPPYPYPALRFYAWLAGKLKR